MSNNITVVGIDPGSSGKGTACVEITLDKDQKDWSNALINMADKKLDPPTLKEKLAEWKKITNSTLLVWDAPLTGPNDPTTEGGGYNKWKHAFTMRLIEQRLKKLLKEKKCEAGISVIDYHGCPHWAVTRHMVGLPVLGRFDYKIGELDYLPIYRSKDFTKNDKCKRIIETHPAVAMWGFLNGKLPEGCSDWKYKSGGREVAKKAREVLLTALCSKWSKTGGSQDNERNLRMIVNEKSDVFKLAINDDNIFDALIAAVLGVLTVTNDKEVKLYGSQSAGAMLLPAIDHFDNALGDLSSN